MKLNILPDGEHLCCIVLSVLHHDQSLFKFEGVVTVYKHVICLRVWVCLCMLLFIELYPLHFWGPKKWNYSLDILKILSFAFLWRIRWEHWYYPHIWVQYRAGVAMNWKQQAWQHLSTSTSKVCLWFYISTRTWITVFAHIFNCKNRAHRRKQRLEYI